MKIGILGGIGPQTTGIFYQQVVERLKNSGQINNRADFPHIIINSTPDPGLPCLYPESLHLNPYINGISELAMHQPDFIVMACNTIHVYLDELKQASGYPHILSARDIVQNTLMATTAPVCLLASPATINSGLYYFPELNYVSLNQEKIAQIGNIIEDYILTNDFKRCQHDLLKIVAHAQALGAEYFITSCTEISLLLRSVADLPVIDTLDLLIDATVNKCLATIADKSGA